MNRIRLALFRDRAQAEPARSGLVEAGIHAEIHDELHLERLWFVTKPTAGARLEVPVKQLDRSLKLLREGDDAQGWLHQAIRCPECASLRIDFPQVTRKSFLTNLAMGLMAELHLVEREYYCEDCHCMWSPQRMRRRERHHMAPNYFVEGIEPVIPSAMDKTRFH
jgi:hypothetical protein